MPRSPATSSEKLQRKIQRVAKHASFCANPECRRATFGARYCYRCVRIPQNLAPEQIRAAAEQIKLENMIRNVINGACGVTDRTDVDRM